jgi:alpha-tubulin suppressor-like RCC1 family protein
VRVWCIDCWGANEGGELGDGTADAYSSTPVVVSGISDAAAIAAGSYHTCALLEGDSINCWDENWGGQLGDGATEGYSDTPVPVSGI